MALQTRLGVAAMIQHDFCSRSVAEAIISTQFDNRRTSSAASSKLGPRLAGQPGHPAGLARALRHRLS